MMIAKQENIEVPVYDLMVNGECVGVMTHLPMEGGPRYTIRHGDAELTGGYSVKTIAEALEEARANWAEFEAGTHWLQQPEPEWIEDEDGEEAAMRAAEDRALAWAERDEAYGYPEYY